MEMWCFKMLLIYSILIISNQNEPTQHNYLNNFRRLKKQERKLKLINEHVQKSLFCCYSNTFDSSNLSSIQQMIFCLFQAQNLFKQFYHLNYPILEFLSCSSFEQIQTKSPTTIRIRNYNNGQLQVGYSIQLKSQREVVFQNHIICINLKDYFQQIISKQLKLIVPSITEGQNKLETFHKSQIQRPQNLQRNQRRLQTSTIDNSIEYIKNPTFSNTICTFFCIWNNLTFRNNYVQAWRPEPEIQIGQAPLYSSHVTTGMAVQLAGKKPTCIWQQVLNVPSGMFELKYQYTARTSVILPKQTLTVYMNDSLIKTTEPQNYSLNLETVSNMSIQNSNSSVILKFCGDPTADGDNIILFWVSFKRFSDLSLQIQTNQTNNDSETNQTAPGLNEQNSTNSDSETNQTAPGLNEQQFYTSQDNSQSFFNQLDIDQYYPGNLFNQDNYQQNLFESTINEDLIKENSPIELNSAQISLLQYILKILFDIEVQALQVDETSSAFTFKPLLRPFFIYLINLDHLWLYIYHQRQYGNNLQELLETIRNYQQAKWDFLINFLQDTLDLTFNLQPISTKLNKKTFKTPTKFYQLQNNSRQFLSNNFKFFIVNFPLVIIIYLLCRVIHYLSQKLNFRQFFKQFTFKSYLILILLEGNSQSFVYFLLSDIINMFSLQIQMKIINVSSVAILFVLFILLVAIPFILRSKYENKIHIEFYDKSKNSFRGALYFLIQFGMFNILLGSTHLLCQNQFSLQLLLLFLVETAFVIYNIVNFKRKNCIFPCKFHIWIGVWASFLRINIIYSTYFYSISPTRFKEKIEYVQLIFIIIYLALWIVSILHVFTFQGYEALKFMIYKIKTLICKKNKSKRGKYVGAEGVTSYQKKLQRMKARLQKDQKKIKVSVICDKQIINKSLNPYFKAKNNLFVKSKQKKSNFHPIQVLKTQKQKEPIQQTVNTIKLKKPERIKIDNLMQLKYGVIRR